MELYKLIKPLGIITYCFVLVTLLTGLFRMQLKYHKLLAILAIILATAHAVIILSSE